MRAERVTLAHRCGTAICTRTAWPEGIRQRFGAIGKTGSIAIAERLWRTLKDALGLGSLKPLTLPDLERRLKTALLHYAYLRPHQSLAGAPLRPWSLDTTASET